MRIGFASIYSWRPHAEHIHFLANLVRKDGHHAEFFTCDADLSSCYTRELRDIRPGWQECVMCRAGGVRSYEAASVSAIGQYHGGSAGFACASREWALSSASTLGRFETERDYASPAFKGIVSRLQPNVEKAFNAALEWIDDKQLEALVVFNGRMDITRAIFEAARLKKINVATLERTWFGDGLQILPGESCLGLQSVDQLVETWSDKPLTSSQARRAASHIASRFLGQNHNEWRAYNSNARVRTWPSPQGRHKVLLIPGSLNEIWGHPDWESAWPHPTEAYDAIIDHFNLKPEDLVLRCHPNWGEKIGKNDGRLSEKHYTSWAVKRGICSISSTDRTSTTGLISQCDAMVIGAGSAGLEAGALGKRIIGISPSNYQRAGMRDNAYNLDELAKLKLAGDTTATDRLMMEEHVRRQTLRFVYSLTCRIPQYVDYVRSLSPTKYVYEPSADPQRLVEILKTNTLEPDDADYSRDLSEEDEVLEKMKAHDWDDLLERQKLSAGAAGLKRRKPFALIDGIRHRMRHGDR